VVESTLPRQGGASCQRGKITGYMAFVYIIQDEISHKHYIGSCLDLSKRVNRHKQHTGASTTRKGNWKLICYKELDNLAKARTLEKKVKSYKSGNAFKKIINGDVAEWSKALYPAKAGRAANDLG